MMQDVIFSYLKKLAPAYLTVLIACQLLLYFSVGGIFHGLLMPMVNHTCFVYLWATSIILIPFVSRAYNRERLQSRLPEVLYLVSCCVFVSIVALRNAGRPHCALGLISALTIYMFLFLAPKLLKKRHFILLFWSICALAGIHAVSQLCFIFGQTQYFCGYSVCMPHGRLMRIPELPLLPLLDGYTGGWFTNPNCLASYIMAVPAISLFLSRPATTRAKALRALALGICALSSMSLMLTFSRAAILTVLFGMIPLALRVLKKRKISTAASVVVVSSLIAGLFLLQMRFTTLTNPFSLTGRSDLWMQAVESLKHLPIFGYGPLLLLSGETPHNVFLANLIFYGVPGLTAFLALIGTSIFLAFRVVRKNQDYGHLALFGFVISYVCAYSQIEYVLTCPYSFSNSVALLTIGFLVSQSNMSNRSAKPSSALFGSQGEPVLCSRS